PQMLRVDQQQLKALLKYVEYWLPVAASAFHSDMGDTLLRQPPPQLLQFVRRRSNVRTCLRGCPLLSGVMAHAMMSFLWMSSPQHRACTTSTTSPPCTDKRARCSSAQILICVLPASTAHHPTVPWSTQAQLFSGLS